MNGLGPARLAVSFTCVFCFAFAFPTQSAKSSVAPAAPVSQGCIDQGSDRRVAATVVCWAQRQLSWKSKHKPHFVLIGKPKRTSIGLALAALPRLQLARWKRSLAHVSHRLSV